MKKVYLSLIALIMFTGLYSQTWVSVATDPSGDGNSPSLLDGTEFLYWYDEPNDLLWFRVRTANLNSSNAQAIGVNIMINAAGAGPTFNFWGNPNTAAYHFLLTAWVTGTPPSNYSGTMGIANAMGVNSMNYTNLFNNNLTMDVDVPNNTIDIALDRKEIVPDAVFTGSSITVSAAAAVGSNQFWNDDIYQPNGQMTLTKSGGIGLEEEVASTVSVYPNPVRDIVSVKNYRSEDYTLSDLSGREIIKDKIPASGTIDLSGLNAGVYFLQTDSKIIRLVKY